MKTICFDLDGTLCINTWGNYEDAKPITKAILKSLNDKKFLKQIKNTKNLYGDGNSAKKIVKILEDIDLNKIPIQKMLMY